jgi:hypothetical protein
MQRERAEREAKARLDTETRNREAAEKAEKAKQAQATAAEKKTRDEREKKEREEDAQRRADEQLKAEELAAKDRAEQLARRRLRQQQAEAREQEVAARAQAAQRIIAQEQLRRDQEKEDAIRKAQQALLVHAQEVYLARQRREQSAYDDQWHTIAQLAQAENEERLRRAASERARLERSAAEEQHRMAQEWEEAKLRRDSQQQDTDVKPSLEDLEHDHSRFMQAAERQRREAEAAERFIQEIVAIHGENKEDVLKDVVLIAIEAVDSEIQTQKTRESGRKRKRATEDPARLPTLVTELFAKLEAGGESSERFRFGKKRKLG